MAGGWIDRIDMARLIHEGGNDTPKFAACNRRICEEGRQCGKAIGDVDRVSCGHISSRVKLPRQDEYERRRQIGPQRISIEYARRSGSHAVVFSCPANQAPGFRRGDEHTVGREEDRSCFASVGSSVCLWPPCTEYRRLRQPRYFANPGREADGGHKLLKKASGYAIRP